MIKNFSIYGSNSKASANDLPAAAKESLVTIVFHNQDKVFKDGEANLGVIKGYMTNEFSHSSNGNYKNVWETAFPDNFFTRLISDETQRNLFNYGYATKKMFSHGESPIITIDFICYSGDDNLSTNVMGLNVNPVTIATMLTNATLPKVADTNAFLATGLSDQVWTGGKAIVNTGAKIVVKTVDGITGDGISRQDFKNGLSDIANDFSSVKPPVCKLSVGNIFEKDMMVVKRVESKFSKEFIEPGIPLFGTFSVTFESLYNASNIVGDDLDKELIFGTGFKIAQSGAKGRVSFDDGSTKSNTANKQTPPTNVGNPSNYEKVK